MDIARLFVDLVTALAWPIVIGFTVWLFRKEIRAVLRAGNARVKAGPFEFGIEQVRVTVATAAALDTSREAALREFVADRLPPELATQAAVDPTGAILGAHAELERTLRDKLAATARNLPQLDRLSASQLAAIAAQEGLITEQAAESVQGVSVLRNLAAHGKAEDVDTQKALDYLALVDATIFSLRFAGSRGADT